MGLPFTIQSAAFSSRTILELNGWLGNPGSIETEQMDLVNMLPATVPTVDNSLIAHGTNDYGLTGLTDYRYVLHYQWSFGLTQRNGAAGDQFATLYVRQSQAGAAFTRIQTVIPLVGGVIAVNWGTALVAAPEQCGQVSVCGRFLQLRVETVGVGPGFFFLVAYLRPI